MEQPKNKQSKKEINQPTAQRKPTQPVQGQPGEQKSVGHSLTNTVKLLLYLVVIVVMGVGLLWSFREPTLAPLTAQDPTAESTLIANMTIESIVSLVNTYCDSKAIKEQGLCNSLLSKLEAALEARDRGQPDVACNQLNAFINEVEAQNENKIPAEVATELIDAAGSACAVIEVTVTPVATGTPVAVATATVTATSEPTVTNTPEIIGIIVTIPPTPTDIPTATPTPTYPPVQYPLVVEGADRQYIFSEPQLISEGTKGWGIVDWTADSQHFFVQQDTDEGYRIQVLDLDGETVADFGSWIIPDRNPVISSDNQMVAFIAYNMEKEYREFTVVDNAQNATVVLEKPRWLAKQPYGDTLWVIDEDYTIIQYENIRAAQQGQEQRRLSLLNHYSSEFLAEWGPYGHFKIAINPVNPNQAVLHLSKEFLVVDIEQQTIQAIDLGERDGMGQYWVNEVAWSPSGNYVAAKTLAEEPPTNFANLTLFETSTWSYQRIDMPNMRFLYDMHWAPSSSDLFLWVDADISESGIGSSKLYLFNNTTKNNEIVMLFDEDIVGYGMLWSQDGKKTISYCSLVTEYNKTYLETGQRSVKKCLIEVQQ